MPNDGRGSEGHDAETISKAKRGQIGGLSDAGDWHGCRGADAANAWIREAADDDGVGVGIRGGIDEKGDHLGHVIVGLDTGRGVFQLHAADSMSIPIEHSKALLHGSSDRLRAVGVDHENVCQTSLQPTSTGAVFMIFLVIYYKICHVDCHSLA